MSKREMIGTLTKFMVNLGDQLYTTESMDIYNSWASKHNYTDVDLDTAKFLLEFIENKQRMSSPEARNFFLEAARIDGYI